MNNEQLNNIYRSSIKKCLSHYFFLFRKYSAFIRVYLHYYILIIYDIKIK